MVRDDIVLPIVDSSVSLFSLGCVVVVFDIHSSVVLVVSDFELTELLSKQGIFADTLLYHDTFFMLLLPSGLLSFNEVVDSLDFAGVLVA